MFSKALFKQSCKSNGVMWTTITLAVCIMLACLMMISGGGNVKALRDGITNTMVQDTMDAQLKSRAVNYYNIVENGLVIFDENFDSSDPQGSLTQNVMPKMMVYVNTICAENGYEIGSTEYQELMGLLIGAFTLDYDMDGTKDIVDTSLPASYLELKTLNMSVDKDSYSRDYSSVFLATFMIQEENVDKIVNQLEKYSIDKETFKNLTYTNELNEEVSRYTGESGYLFIKDLGIDAILNFVAKFEYETSLLDTSSPTYLEDIENIRQNLITEAGNGFLSSLPSDISDSLQELGTMNLFSLITGSIFFKMAGILLPIIYVIMVANNLIAGQVDSGSMAYVLSTSAKRSQIVFTQAIFLVSSLFGMFLLTTATSFICYSILSITGVDISLSSLALLNLGAFITLFAMSGISFLTSCWFNRSKYSMGIGGGINMFFLVSTILGLFGSQVLPSVLRIDSLNFFNYCSIISLFDEVSILNGTTDFVWKLCILFGIGLVCYFIGSIKFKKKDLPL